MGCEIVLEQGTICVAEKRSLIATRIRRAAAAKTGERMYFFSERFQL